MKEYFTTMIRVKQTPDVAPRTSPLYEQMIINTHGTLHPAASKRTNTHTQWKRK